jgi:hypothetical protein
MAKGDIREPDDTVHLKLRLPEHLRRQIEDAAKEAGHSMNTEISWRLTETFSPSFKEYRSIVTKQRVDQRRLEEEIMKKIMTDPKVQDTFLTVIRGLVATDLASTKASIASAEATVAGAERQLARLKASKPTDAE